MSKVLPFKPEQINARLDAEIAERDREQERDRIFEQLGWRHVNDCDTERIIKGWIGDDTDDDDIV